MPPTRSSRDYTYLPNGQLGKIVTRSVSGAQSRLIDMVVTKQPVINTGIYTVR